MRRLLGEVLSEGGLGGVGGTGTALDRRAEALARRVALGAGLVRDLERVSNLVERRGDRLEQLILRLVLELVGVRDVVDTRGERGENNLILGGDVGAVGGENEGPARHELADQSASRALLVGCRLGNSRVPQSHDARSGTQVAHQSLELVVQGRLEGGVESLHDARLAAGRHLGRRDHRCARVTTPAPKAHRLSEPHEVDTC